MEDIKAYLLSQSKHGLYQMLPPTLIKKMPELEKFSFSRRLDDKRYEWFSEKLDFDGKRVMDIGGNIGYFSFRLASEKNAHLTIYEPQEQHIKAIESIKPIIDMPDEKVKCVNQGVGLDDIKTLPEQDIILLFNVLQHAGEDYDKKYVPDISHWRDYTISYLQALRSKTKNMVFQMGYTWLGHEDSFCHEEDFITFTVKLLEDAGWKINNCGVIGNVLNPHYVDLEFNEPDAKHPIINQFDMFTAKGLNKLKIVRRDYSFMQRPVFICNS